MKLSPSQYAALKKLLSDQEWRLNNLYCILDKNGKIQRFKMNWAQLRLHREKHTRNNVLKVRQLGISTYVALLMLDSCLFSPNTTAGIVDRTSPEAKKKLAKIKFAFENMGWCPQDATPQQQAIAALGAEIKRAIENQGKVTIGKEEATFPNGSIIYASVSLRGGTHQLVHVSELGSVALHNPLKAEETISGTFNSVGKECSIIMESTHEGGEFGANYFLIEQAMSLIGKPLTPLDFKFFFFSWIEQAEYALPGYNFSGDLFLAKYFESLEKENNIRLTEAQKAWYEAMHRTHGTRKMRQEYPTTPGEALHPIAQGTIFGQQIDYLRELGRLNAEFEPDPYRPIYAAFDIGMADFTSIWWVQPGRDGKFYLLDNYTANNKGTEHYISVLRQHDTKYGQQIAAVILPHDGVRRDYSGTEYWAKIEEAGYSHILVPRTQDKWASIDTTRTLLRSAVIHARCSEKHHIDGITGDIPSGVNALSNYRMAPPNKSGVIRNEPLHDMTSHACDALRTFSDAWARGLIAAEKGWREDPRTPSRTSGIARGAEILYRD